MSWIECGTVEILRDRVYNLDPEASGAMATTVYVEPGTYPLYHNEGVYCWVMSGRINERIERLGDGLFGLHQGDRPMGLRVQFPSRSLSLADLREIMDDPAMESRLRVALNPDVLQGGAA